MNEWLSLDSFGTEGSAAATVIILFMLLFALSGYQQKREARRREVRRLAESEACLQLALWGSGQWFWQYDVPKERLLCAELARRLGRRDGARLPFRALAQCLVHPGDRAALSAALQSLVAGARELDIALRVLTSAGDYHWLRWRGRVATVDAESRAVRVIGTCKDVTEERDAEAQLRLAASVMESVSDAIVVFDLDLHASRINTSFTAVTGYSADDIRDAAVTVLLPTDGNTVFEREIRPALASRGGWEGEHWMQRRDGQLFLARMRITNIVGDGGNVTHHVATFSDVTEKKESEQQLQYLASHDTLTGLLNRNALAQHLDNAILRARPPGNRIAVLFLDMNQFKQINDSFGHAFGDDVLRAAANRIGATLRFEDAVARFGGDEFVVVLERIGNRQNVLRVVTKLTEAFRRDLDIPDQELIITPSIGISLFPDDATSASELIDHADAAMYEAKKLAHANHSFYDGAMNAGVRDELKRENQLRHALENDEFRLHYQPIVDGASGRLRGLEALLRWENPFDGMLMPGEFVHLAEQRGLIGDIGRWALSRACADLRQLNRRLGLEVYVAVNVSSAQVRDPAFLAIVHRALAESGLDPRLLHLELTESMLMDCSRQVVQALIALRDLGLQIALDDFGTGYSSLGYLRRFPISKLKIDRSFVRDVPGDESAASIVTTIIALGHAMGLALTAEGVESEAQRRFLERHGCQEQQGFHFSSPLRLAEVQRLYANPPPHESRVGVARHP